MIENKLLKIGITAIVVILFSFSNTNLIAQKDAIKKSNLYNKIESKIKEVKSNDFKISGKIGLTAGYRYTLLKSNFDFRTNANVNIKYKGINIPLSYNYSNGRSITQYNLPSYKTPKFNNLGISPTYGWAKLHFGHRQMSFSKYTYDNLRFKGYGLELKPKKFQLMLFNGQLFTTSTRDLYFNGNVSGSYVRKAWGTMFGYLTEKDELSAIVFKADDDTTRIIQNSKAGLTLPKSNTVVSIRLKKTLFEKFEIKFEKAMSALTKNQYDQPIHIATHSTVYNMWGLYTKKASSQYREATMASVSYSQEKYKLTYNFEEIAKDYRSMGSLFFDNAYTSNTINVTGTPNEKLNLSTEFGARSDRIVNEKSGSSKRFVTNSMVSYQFSDFLNSTLAYSNFKNTQSQYYQRINSLEVDSFTLALVNSNINLSTNYFLNKEKTKLLNFVFSNQRSNSIERDSLNASNLSINYLYNLSYANKQEKQSWQSNLALIINKNNFNNIKMINASINHSYNLSKISSITNGMQTSFQSIIDKNRFNLMIINGYDLAFSKKGNFKLTSRTSFTNPKNKFVFQEWYIELNSNYGF